MRLLRLARSDKIGRGQVWMVNQTTTRIWITEARKEIVLWYSVYKDYVAGGEWLLSGFFQHQ